MNTPLRKLSKDEAENVALNAFSFIASDDERLSRFLVISGLQANNIRSAAAAPGFLAAVLDYVASDEPLLISLAKELDMKPEHIMVAHWTLSPSEID